MSDDLKESDIYDAVTGLFLGVPAALAIPVLCEALIHALNCVEQDAREDMRDASLACLREHVDLRKGHIVGFAT